MPNVYRKVLDHDSYAGIENTPTAAPNIQYRPALKVAVMAVQQEMIEAGPV